MYPTTLRTFRPIVKTGGNDVYATTVKRVVDVVLVLIAAPIASVFIACLALVCCLDGGSPFYCQHRVGRHGRLFRCWKLRTMRPNADRILAALLICNPILKSQWEATNKLCNDPRVTWFGRFLRASSLDELPQLWNVLRGDMSLVGPRPIPKQELQKYGSDAVHYLSLRPGLTGVWQTSGRNSVCYDTRVAMDVAYKQSVSFWLDAWIIARTFKTVLMRTGV